MAKYQHFKYYYLSMNISKNQLSKKTENPCVRGSIPRVGTKNSSQRLLFFCLIAEAVLKAQRGIEKERRLTKLRDGESARNSPVDYFVATRVVFR